MLPDLRPTRLLEKEAIHVTCYSSCYQRINDMEMDTFFSAKGRITNLEETALTRASEDLEQHVGVEIVNST